MNFTIKKYRLFSHNKKGPVSYIMILSVLLLSLFPVVCLARETSQTDNWNGYERVHVKVGAFSAYYVKPTHALRGNPWVWRASFPDWHTEIDTILLSKGMHVAYISVDDRYGSPESVNAWDEFYGLLTKSAHLSSRPALEAVSRGALYALAWAKRNPGKVSCIYAETPVYDIKSWPGGKGSGPGDPDAWKQLLGIYGFTEQQAMDYRQNPVDNLEGLAAFGVPVLNVIGIEDRLTPRAENSDVFASRYSSFGGPVWTYPITIGPKELMGHHFPIAAHAEEFARFILGYASRPKSPLSFADYFDIGKGLGSFFDRMTTHQQPTVAFVGGSITYNPGWREKICRRLKERYPRTEFRFISAGIPSLGSLPHAFRLQQDVLDSGRIDLMFLETAVNDRVNGTDSMTQIRALEGIVRHVRNRSPAADIVLMSFADPDKNADFDRHRTPVEIANTERVGAHYGLPTLDLAKAVHDKMKNGEFTWDNDFRDLHPSVFGQELYAEAISELLDSAENATKAGAVRSLHFLPPPMDPQNFSEGLYCPVGRAARGEGWTYSPDWSPAGPAGTRPGFVHLPVLSSETPGAETTLMFKGTAIGIASVSGPDAGRISYSVDGGPFRTKELFTVWSGSLHLPWYILLEDGLRPGKHRLVIRIMPDKNPDSRGYACRIAHFLVNGAQ